MTERLRILRDDRDGRLEHVRERDVVEADQGGSVLTTRPAKRPDAADSASPATRT